MTLVEFLRARLDEDEEIAKQAKPGPWTNDGGVYATHPTDEVVDWAYGDSAGHIARHDPARVLREVTAKRRTLDLHGKPDVNSWDPDDKKCTECGGYTIVAGLGDRGYQRRWPCPTMRLLALPYADHPDYQPDWTP